MKGNHGYDPSLPDMHAIFLAKGPSFHPSTSFQPNSWNNIYRIPSFTNLEVYNLISRILGIRPSPNNGTMGVHPNLLKVMIE